MSYNNQSLSYERLLAAIPFLIILLISLVIITYVPDLSLWLVKTAGLP